MACCGNASEDVRDAAGNGYEFFGAPDAAAHWSAKEQTAFYDQVASHLREKANNLVVDLRGFSSTQVSEIATRVDALNVDYNKNIIKIGWQ